MGLAIAWDNVRLTFSQVQRSREFDGQPKSQDYGSLSLQINF